MGRSPLGAQTRRRIGLSPMRCSSVAQTSTGLSGCFALSSATACSSLFSTPRAPPAWPRQDGAGGASAPTSRSPSAPPSPVGVRPQQARVRLPSRPPPLNWSTAPIGRRRTKTRLELVQQLRLQNRRSRAVPAAQVAQSVQTLSLGARQQTLDPAPGIRHRGRNLGDVVPFGQKPDFLDLPRPCHFFSLLILLFYPLHSHIILHIHHCSPPRLM